MPDHPSGTETPRRWPALGPARRGAGSYHGAWGNPWTRLWREVAAAPEFFRERRAQPLELAEAVAEPALSVLLCTMLVAGIATFLTALLPVFDLSGIVVVAACTATAGYFYGRRLQWSRFIWREWLVLLAPFVVLWRAITALTLGPPPGDVVGRWIAHPSALLDGAFVSGGLLLLLAWGQGVGYGRDLAALHPPPEPARPRPEPGSRDYWEEDERRHGLFLPPPRAVATRWLRGGVLLAVLAALGAAGVRQTLTGAALLRLATFGAPDESAALPNVLLYLLGGLVLIGLAQSSRLRVNWAADGVVVAPGLARRALGGLGALVVIALAVALLLPTRYSLGLGDLLRTVFALAAYAANLITTLLLSLVALIVDLVAGLFGGHGHPLSPPRPAHAPRLAPVHGGAGGVLGSLLFWLAALAAAGYCAYMLLRQAEGRVPGVARARRLISLLARGLAALLRLVAGGVRRGAAGVASAVRRLGGEARARAGMPAGRLSMRRMGPREKVAYLYLAVEERARRLGLPRHSGQTALEYSRRLRREMPDLDPDLSALTDVFMEARYSPHPFGEERVGGARRFWQRVRSRLRARRK